MTYEQLLNHFKTQQGIAKALGVKQPSVSYWSSHGVPYLRQLQAQFITGGVLVADSKIEINQQVSSTQE